jgi:hypothetical protein
MPRPTLIDRPMQKCLQLPTSTVVNVELQLYSPLDGRVPQGALNNLVNRLLLDWLSRTGKVEGTEHVGI